MNFISKILLAPFAGIYAAIIYVRNFMYDKHYFRSVKFDTPVIAVGNLSTGGTGKTPHIDYLAHELKEHYPIAILSRGYKRKSSGFLTVQPTDTALRVGDEPLLLKWKHPEVAVAVAENRALGIPNLLRQNHEAVILLDDAFQHRAVRAGLSILLSSYHNLYTQDEIIPWGNLRESKQGAKRADIILVTNSPIALSKAKKEAIIKEIKPKSYQYVFFTSVTYQQIYAIENKHLVPKELEKESHIILVSGIADNSALVHYLEHTFAAVHTRSFSDHHHFDSQDIESIINTYKHIDAQTKYLVTTEKDATRLLPFIENLNKNGISIHCLPIKINFAKEDKDKFNKLIHFYIDKTIELYHKAE